MALHSKSEINYLVRTKGLHMYELSGLFELCGVGLVVLRVGGEAVLVLGVGLDGDALWGGDHQVVIHHNTLQTKVNKCEILLESRSFKQKGGF